MDFLRGREKKNVGTLFFHTTLKTKLLNIILNKIMKELQKWTE